MEWIMRLKSEIVLACCLVSLSTLSYADKYVGGYTRSNGTYVQGHMRSNADSSFGNNYSTRGNINPYTGQAGTKTSSYESGGYGRSSTGYQNSHYGQSTQSQSSGIYGRSYP